MIITTMKMNTKLKSYTQSYVSMVAKSYKLLATIY